MEFYLSKHSGNDGLDREAALSTLCEGWSGFSSRFNTPEDDWVVGLSDYLEEITEMRAAHAQKWISQNLDRFEASDASLETLKRACNATIAELRENVHLCKAQCSSCNLLCIKSCGHDSQHDCWTSHQCPHPCDFNGEHPGKEKECGFRHVTLYNNLELINPFTVLDI